MRDIIILHARDIKKASPIVASRPFGWLYLGQDIKQRETISQALGKENRYIIGDLLQKVAYQQKQPFLDFIAELGGHQKNRRHWWASNIAYRSPLASDFFLLWCYAAVFENICLKKRDEGEGLLFVFVGDRWLYRHLWERYKGNGSSFSFLSRKSVIPELSKLIARGIAARGYFLLRLGWQIWQAKGTISKNKGADFQSNGKEIYIYSWIRDRFFQENGEFEDAYLGRLPQLMSSNGLSVVYIAPLFVPPALKGKCLNHSGYKFIFLDHYVSLWSLVQSSFSVLSISFPSKLNSTFSPLRTLLLREMAYEFSSFPGNIVEYFAFKECLKKREGRRMVIVYPFENQPWEKMLCLAAKEVGKNIKLVGYQHSHLPSLLLSYFIGAGESENMPLPDVIVANGEHTLELLKNAGYGKVELINGGALRYEHLYETGDSTKREKEIRAVLVALPYSRSLSEEMLMVIFGAFRDLAEEKLMFIIKFHPEVPLERLEIQLPPWPGHFQRTEKPMAEILKEVDLVIYSSSTIGLEALLGGVPVIRYCPEHIIDLDASDAFGEGVVKSCSEDDIKQAVLSALNGGNSHLAEDSIPTDILSKLFSPVDEDVWRQIVKL